MSLRSLDPRGGEVKSRKATSRREIWWDQESLCVCVFLRNQKAPCPPSQSFYVVPPNMSVRV